ncbi:MAG: aminotransferase class I/II-fold pyridoxal phosphate-dependent enzyme [Dehalococcoidia bacterium]|nr:aminotransferase class I/II-fold pyridoxal phosphate-dependent enzyme [Dehalococcoidia bacterium]
MDGYDDDASRDVFDKARAFSLPRTAKAFGLYPFYKALDSNEGPEAIIDGKRVIMLGSNNYLGLTRHPRVVQATSDAVKRYGTSMTGSRLLNGTTVLHERLEELLATFFGAEACLTFTTGYQANLGTISALVNRRAVVVIDKADHASIYDGCALSDGEMVRFRHNDVEHLEQTLAKVTQEKSALVAIDGVFSMGGDIARLPEIMEVCRRYNARLLLDDAHGVGVLGEGGRGTASHFSMLEQMDLIVGTFSKSLASIGGFVTGPAHVIEWLKHFARPGVFSASMPPASVVAATTALEVLMEEPRMVDKLNANAELLRNGLRNAGFDIGASVTPIVPILIGDEVKMVNFWKELLAGGVYTNAVIFPAVPRGAGILRTSCMATHSPEQIKKAVALMAELGRRHKVIPE